jgi:hypothetical protein
MTKKLLSIISVLLLCGCTGIQMAAETAESETVTTTTAVTIYVPFYGFSYNITEASSVNTDELSAEELEYYRLSEIHHLHEPAQDFTDLPYYDDFSDKEFTYKYISSSWGSLWEVKDDRLVVENDNDERPAAATIGYYGWQNYTASVDFKLPQDNQISSIRRGIYGRISGEFRTYPYAVTVNSDGNWYAGDSQGIHNYERHDENYGNLVTGTFEDFNPEVWNRIYMISENGKLYIDLNSQGRTYICDLDPNSAGAIRIQASSGTEFDNLAIESGMQ